mmetsp:Transcript_88357/g.122613  ORF Transcript_88357/g.122613 Transcript_88357/m.122613 type:complete len:112 (+) Transcript_88357:114-449(+)
MQTQNLEPDTPKPNTLTSGLLTLFQLPMNLIILIHDLLYDGTQVTFSPLIEKIPRKIGNFTIFTANGVTYFRMLLAPATAFAIKMGHKHLAFILILLHEVFDNLDGIIARV